MASQYETIQMSIQTERKNRVMKCVWSFPDPRRQLKQGTLHTWVSVSRFDLRTGPEDGSAVRDRSNRLLVADAVLLKEGGSGESDVGGNPV